MKGVFEAMDGQIFGDSATCIAHEQKLVEAWVATNPTINVQELIKRQPDQQHRDDLMDILHQWFLSRREDSQLGGINSPEIRAALGEQAHAPETTHVDQD